MLAVHGRVDFGEIGCLAVIDLVRPEALAGVGEIIRVLVHLLPPAAAAVALGGWMFGPASFKGWL